MSAARGAPVIRVTRIGFLHWCQVRQISSTHQQSFPRKKESVGDVPKISDDHWRPTFKDPTSKVAVEALKTAQKYTPPDREEPRRRLPQSQLKPVSEYRQSIIDNSTKNSSVVPKKWKRLLLNREVVNVVMFLKRAKGNRDAVKEAVKTRVCRLLKLEMMLVLSELQRTDEWVLANQVFNVIRKEGWYKPDIYLYQTMVQLFGRCKQINEAQRMFVELEAEGLQPHESIRRELLRAYVFNKMMMKAIDLYKDIQKCGLEQNTGLDRASRSILFHGLTDEQKEELSIYEKRLGYDWS